MDASLLPGTNYGHLGPVSKTNTLNAAAHVCAFLQSHTRKDVLSYNHSSTYLSPVLGVLELLYGLGQLRMSSGGVDYLGHFNYGSKKHAN